MCSKTVTIAPYSILVNRLMSHFFKVLHYSTNHSERFSVSVYSTRHSQPLYLLRFTQI